MKNKIERANVTQCLYGVSDSKRFLKNVQELLPDNIKEITITSFGMKKASGHGSYNYVLNVDFGTNYNEEFKKFTHDSVDYDYQSDLELGRNYENWVKSRILSMLSKDSIHDQIRDRMAEITEEEEEEESNN